ncbi:MAG: aldo/keto reductase [Lachnospiraceae bacterium]|nr:aldo/keto reductase [Lachnospiraceae bacterium]
MGEIEVKGTGKLGFGLMRLPRTGVMIDIPQVCEMVDRFMEAGFTYYDTAFIYPGSENAAKKALVERYPRESYTLATKLYASVVPLEKAAKAEFETSLNRTGAGYFDYYLLHTLNARNYKKYEKFHLWDFVREEKEKGRIKHYGFSFHDSPELLDLILTEHPDTEFVQLQINYADWESPTVHSREIYEVARRHGKPIVVMEPVKGGGLANPPQNIKDIFDSYDPNASYASWAIRFAASLDGILSVLSGMSNIAQMEDNLSYMKDFKPLSDEEQKVIQKAQAEYGKLDMVPCTACRYCTEGCPKKINIPEIFAAVNMRKVGGQIDRSERHYSETVAGGSSASDCIKCRQCEQHCPQHIQIADELERAAKLFEAE